MKKLIIFGNGKQAKCTSKMFEKDGVKVFGFCVDDEYYKDDNFIDKPVFKLSELIIKCPTSEFMVFLPLSAADKCRFRKQKFFQLKELGYEFFTFINPNSHSYTNIENIGFNVYIGLCVGIHPDVKIDDNVYVADYALIGHDAHIKSHGFIASGAIIGASSILEERVTIGLGSIIKEGTKIPEGTIVGMGVSIHRDIERPKIYAFTPIEEEHYERRRNKRIV